MDRKIRTLIAHIERLEAENEDLKEKARWRTNSTR